MPSRFTIIDAPSILGLRLTGINYLPEALKAAGLMKRLNADYAGRVSPLPYNLERDKVTLLLNPETIKTFSIQLADMVSSVIRSRRYPIVLGGDCSIMIGNLLALRRLGRYGLFFIDGHADFYQTEASLTGEVADMDIALYLVEVRMYLLISIVLNHLYEIDIILFGYPVTENKPQVLGVKMFEIPEFIHLILHTRKN